MSSRCCGQPPPITPKRVCEGDRGIAMSRRMLCPGGAYPAYKGRASCALGIVMRPSKPCRSRRESPSLDTTSLCGWPAWLARLMRRRSVHHRWGCLVPARPPLVIRPLSRSGHHEPLKFGERLPLASSKTGRSTAATLVERAGRPLPNCADRR